MIASLKTSAALPQQIKPRNPHKWSKKSITHFFFAQATLRAAFWLKNSWNTGVKANSKPTVQAATTMARSIHLRLDCLKPEVYQLTVCEAKVGMSLQLKAHPFSTLYLPY